MCGTCSPVRIFHRCRPNKRLKCLQIKSVNAFAIFVNLNVTQNRKCFVEGELWHLHETETDWFRKHFSEVHFVVTVCGWTLLTAALTNRNRNFEFVWTAKIFSTKFTDRSSHLFRTYVISFIINTFINVQYNFWTCIIVTTLTRRFSKKRSGSSYYWTLTGKHALYRIVSLPMPMSSNHT